MGVSGRSFSDETVRRVVWLLTSTDMTIEEIAKRMSCCRNTVLGINRKFRIRDYGGRRSSWRIASTAGIDEEKKSA